MIRIFESNEIPIGFIEAIKQKNINISSVKFVIHEDFKCTSVYDILSKFNNYEPIPLITDDYIYVVFR